MEESFQSKFGVQFADCFHKSCREYMRRTGYDVPNRTLLSFYTFILRSHSDGQLMRIDFRFYCFFQISNSLNARVVFPRKRTRTYGFHLQYAVSSSEDSLKQRISKPGSAVRQYESCDFSRKMKSRTELRTFQVLIFRLRHTLVRSYQQLGQDW